MGKAIRGHRILILDADGAQLPAGEIGEIWIESDQSRAEYYKDPAKSQAMRRGRLVTLGIGFLADAGFLFLRDRKVDLIISGGANIYPAEVEAALLEDPEEADATVIGIPDDQWGEQVKAVVQIRAGIAPDRATERALIARCRERIAHYKCPRSVDFVVDLPRLPNGKVEKRRLRDPYWADRDIMI